MKLSLVLSVYHLWKSFNPILEDCNFWLFFGHFPMIWPRLFWTAPRLLMVNIYLNCKSYPPSTGATRAVSIGPAEMKEVSQPFNGVVTTNSKLEQYEFCFQRIPLQDIGKQWTTIDNNPLCSMHLSFYVPSQA